MKGLFKHTSFLLTLGALSVSRRYSDFVWLYKVLVKKYPFRSIPRLPPKKVVVTPEFIEKRRRGLLRFIMCVANHPVMQHDTIVIDFVSFAHTIAEYKVSKNFDYQPEFSDMNVTETLNIPQDLGQTVETFKLDLHNRLKYCMTLVQQTETQLRLLSALSTNHAVLGQTYQAFAKASKEEPVSEFENIGNGLESVSEIYTQQMLELSLTLLESLLSKAETLIAFQDLFVRIDTVKSEFLNNLEQRILINERNLADLRSMGKLKEMEKTELQLNKVG
jgi:sorting nexin-8